MSQVSEKKSNFVSYPSNGYRHREERVSFCPSENLENSSEKAIELKVTLPVVCSSLSLYGDGDHIPSYGCELNFILFSRVIQNLQKESVMRAHTLCRYSRREKA